MTTEQLLIESLIGQTESRAIFELRYTTLQTKSVQLEAKNIELDSALKACGVKVTQLASDLQKMREDSSAAKPRLHNLYTAAHNLLEALAKPKGEIKKDMITEYEHALRSALHAAHGDCDQIPF